MRPLKHLLLAFVLVLSTNCARDDGKTSSSSGSPWNGRVELYGALKAMFHEGRIGPAVGLNELLPNSQLYAVGALAGLEGEITVVAGRVYLAYPEGDAARIEIAEKTDAGAALLAVTEVPRWRTLVIKQAIQFEDLDREIAELATEAGMNTEGRFPFLIEGRVEDLRWHVIDGRRLAGGGTSHEDHLAAAARFDLEATPVTLIGFYSAHDQGVITHMGSNTHVHCVMNEPSASGHVDHVTIPAGTTVKFPSQQGGIPQ